MIRVFSFWYRGKLGLLEQLCLRSMVHSGHEVNLYTYEEHLAVPQGVTVRRAQDILPESRVVRHEKTGSLSLFADIFRYEGLKRELGLWLDVDVLVIKDFDRMGDHVFGWQNAAVINNAILRLPPNSECLSHIISLYTAKTIMPPFWSRTKKTYQYCRSVFGSPLPLQSLGWGVIGPFALTHYVKQEGLAHRAQSVDVFYPISHEDVELFINPNVDLDSFLMSGTRAIHLWNSLLQPLLRGPLPPGSFLAKMCERFELDPNGGAAQF